MTKKRKVNKARVLYILIALGLSMFFIGGSVGLFFITTVVADAPEFEISRLDSQESTRIYDRKGELITDIGVESRQKVAYEQLPQVLIDAFVSIEDSRFFEHNGFDLPRFMKAALENLKTMSFSQGGSTVTMQVIDNAYFMDMSTVNLTKLEKVGLKIQEIYLSIKAEQVLEKKNIFELYINKINFGAHARGIQKGAQYYFGKDVEQLNLSEAALLAGVVNEPNALNPYVNLEKATARRNQVLYLMQYHGYITKEEEAMAKSIKIENQLAGETGGEALPFQSYIDSVLDEAQKKTGKDPARVPMEIYTYMDRDAQTKADELLAGKGVTYPKNDELFQTGFSVIETKTGHIVALGGGRNINVQRGLNRANIKQQPGSTAKPILAYAMAFDHLGWATSHVVEDKPVVYRGTKIMLPNVDGIYLGEITLNEAIARSRNTSAMLTYEKLADKLGTKPLIEHIQRMGFDIDTSKFNLGYVIGASYFEATPTELASAYAILANEGMHIEPHTIRRIVFLEGDEPIEPSYLPTQVISPEAAFLTSVMLQGAVESPWYNYMQILKNPNYKVYAKTGTTDYGNEPNDYGIPMNAMKDKWVSAYTSEYSVSVWTGYDKPVSGKETWFTQAKSQLNIPVTIAKEMLFFLHKDSYPAPVQPTNNITSITHVLGAYPYAAPSDGMSEDSIITGYIKKENANLVSISPEPISHLSSFTADYQQETNTLVFHFAEYPDVNRTLPAGNVIEYELEHRLNGKDLILTAQGQRLFDSKLYFGSVQYKVDIIANGEVIASHVASTLDSAFTVPLLPTQQVTVCGYYGLSIAQQVQSNQICTDVTIPNIFLPDPGDEDDWGWGGDGDENTDIGDNDDDDDDDNGEVIDPFS